MCCKPGEYATWKVGHIGPVAQGAQPSFIVQLLIYLFLFLLPTFSGVSIYHSPLSHYIGWLAQPSLIVQLFIYLFLFLPPTFSSVSVYHSPLSHYIIGWLAQQASSTYTGWLARRASST